MTDNAATAGAQSKQELLRVDGVSKRYGGLTAVDGVVLAVATDEILSIIGPNGAGKTTLFNVVSGVDRASEGTVKFLGKQVDPRKRHRLARMGLTRTYQRTELVDELDAAGNLLLALDAARWRPSTGQRGFWRPSSESRDRVSEVLEKIGVDERPDVMVGERPTEDRHRIAIGMAWASDPYVILLDEPTGGLTETETEGIAQLVSRIRDDGCSVVVIEHKMSLVMSLSDRVAVLDQGRLIALGTPQEVRHDPVVIEAYLGGGSNRDDS